MDGGKGGQTLSLQAREGENRKQSANLGRNEKEKKKPDQPGQGDSGQEGPRSRVTGREQGWAGQKAHDGGLGDGVAKLLSWSNSVFDHGSVIVFLV